MSANKKAKTDAEVVAILGTMTFGWNKASSKVDDTVGGAFLDAFIAAGCDEVDTAYAYAGGETENMLGRLLAANDGARAKKLLIATKANPWSDGHGGGGNLCTKELNRQAGESLTRMNADHVDIFYLHAPDQETPIEESLAAANALHAAGKFSKLGLSNYTPWEVTHIWHVCDKKGWVKPSVYQGMYNAITRAVEAELFPVLAMLNIRFLAYNPLAAGLLTGKHSQQNDLGNGRFEGNKMYQDRFWKESYFSGLDLIKAACDAAGMSMVDASLRWLKSHSQLKSSRRDGIIIGASSIGHLQANLAACQNSDPLPEAVVDAYDAAWKLTQADCPSFSRGFSKYEGLDAGFKGYGKKDS